MAANGDRVGAAGKDLAGPRRRALIRPAGIPVRADASLLIIAGLVAWNFWVRFGTVEAGGTAVAMALAATALFLGSILVHELAHAVEARRRGLHVEDITLYVFGGATRITTEVARPADEAAMTAVGPWTSIALGCGFGLVAHAAGASPVGEVAGELGWLNIILGVFNLLPGAPLDGGRLLDAAVWRVTGDRARAARVATGAGQVLGVVLAALGLAVMLFVSGGFVAGLWQVLIGSFLAWAAGSERKAAILREALRGRPVRAVTSPVAVVPAGASLEEAMAACLRLGRTDAALVTGPDGAVIGVLDLDAAARRAAAQPRPGPAGALMAPVAELPAVQADAPAADLLPLAGEAPVVVLDGTAVRSVVTGASLAAAARWMTRLPREEPETPAGTGSGAAARPPAAPAGRPGRRGAGHLALLAASAGVVASAVATVPMPVADLAPGPALDVPAMLTSQGPVHPVAGQLLLTSVSVSSPSAAGVVRAFFSPGHELTWPASLVPAGIKPEDWAAAQVQVFRDSVQQAAAVALRAAGYPVRVEGGGAVVWAVIAGGPADGLLRPGDVVTGIGGQPVASAAGLAAQVTAVPAGTAVTVTVRRGDQSLDVTVRPTLSAEMGRPALGVAVDDAAPLVQLPFAVDVRRTDIGGPSAGLMTALAVYAVTTGTDVTAGRVVAGTGTIDAAGRVGAVGGVAQKVAAAADAGARLFLVPSSEAATARQAASGRPVQVVPVDSFDAALRVLGVSPARAG
jgi:PDZ domain-containing secreted protein/Zn-dependent protease